MLAAPRDGRAQRVLEAQMTQDGENSILLHRLPKGDKPGIWLCLACDHPANFTADEQGGAKALVSRICARR